MYFIQCCSYSVCYSMYQCLVNILMMILFFKFSWMQLEESLEGIKDRLCWGNEEG